MFYLYVIKPHSPAQNNPAYNCKIRTSEASLDVFDYINVIIYWTSGTRASIFILPLEVEFQLHEIGLGDFLLEVPRIPLLIPSLRH